MLVDILFCLQAESPDVSLIPTGEAVGVTVVLLSCAYRQQEFIKIGYFVANEYDDPDLIENPPDRPVFAKVTRSPSLWRTRTID